MIGVISGLGESSTSWAQGLNDLAASLRDACPRWKVNRYAHNWDFQRAIENGEIPNNEPSIWFGHSFGGCTACKIARLLSGAATWIFDGVWWEKGDPFAQLKKVNQIFIPDPFVIDRCHLFLRDGEGVPVHFKLPDSFVDADQYTNIVDGGRFTCEVVAGTDHNSIVHEPALRSKSVIFARDLYRRWLRAQVQQTA